MKKNIIFLLALIVLLGISCSEDTIDEEFTGSISGTVISDETGESLSNVRISTNPASSTVFSNSEGAFVLSNILVDDYSVQAELDGFNTGFEAVSVLIDATSTVAFELDLTTTFNQSPTMPELLSPEDGTEGLDTDVELAWDSIDPENDELIYSVQLRNGTTNSIETFTVVSDTTFTVTNLSLATNYFWQVIVDDQENDPISSEISSFRTLDTPSNPILFVRLIDGNNVIFSGAAADNNNSDVNVQQITNDQFNSFRPKKNLDVSRIAFLRTIGGNTQLFTMSLAGDNIQQITSAVPVAGFRQEEIQYAWFQGGSKLIYPNFDKLYSIDNDGGGIELIYQTTDGSLITEVDVPEINDDVIVLKTNDINGYNTRIFTLDLETETVQDVIYEDQDGASGGIDISANATTLLYTVDVSGEENPQYRRFESRLFIYNFETGTSTELLTGTGVGENILSPRYSPTEGEVIFTRVDNNVNAIPTVFFTGIENMADSDLLFTDGAKMPNWE